MILHTVKSAAHITRRGFTMIELLVVITIIGVLTGLGVWAGTALFKQSDEAKRSSSAAVIKAALSTYYTENGEYPDGDDENITSAIVTYGNVSDNHLDRSNITFLMELFGRDSSGKRQDDKRAYITDTSMFYYCSGSSVVKLDEAKSISSNGVIGFPIKMQKTSQSEFKRVSDKRAFAPIQITIDYNLKGHVTVTVPNETDFRNVIAL
ncbi:MAG: prepilin-type N-terminal cleavage/methylation domain-containing protein [bacterium]|nr:prepilin-type N-terminal cleavage/methylation domain-containing protein [bacterium]MDO5463253.1 prepilin-type N-terminal cleavage/methylation domain-containing protein [bacterium]